MSADRTSVTGVLRAFSRGQPGAADQLFEAIHTELRDLAAGLFGREHVGHTLQPTALVNEAFLRLVDANGIDWQDRRHFLAVAARVMRRVLVDHARTRAAQKRGGAHDRVTLVDDIAAGDGREVDLVALDEALTRLAARSERRCSIVELRYFAGLGVEETAQQLGISETTVKTDWKVARAFLRAELAGDDDGDA